MKTHHTLHLSGNLAPTLKQLASDLGDLRSAIEDLVELSDDVANAVSIPPQLDLSVTPGVGALEHHAVVDVGSEYRDLCAATGALGADLKVVLDRHREALQSALSALSSVDGTDRPSSGEEA